ncbi:hypothetical protein [Bacillus massilinigeriensis]|uniref:hypothetical protein n=1 Tax=Bacillus mediterraneensis TaxID=1805474 RepID=UPI0013567263|nr:hypothetical protein [Bacillus mediterraneensis]
MVNENRKNFFEAQKQRGKYIGDAHGNKSKPESDKYNTRENTDKSPGTTGRE